MPAQDNTHPLLRTDIVIQIHGGFPNVQFNPVDAAAESTVLRVVGLTDTGTASPIIPAGTSARAMR
jgi:hypothetical protein